MIYMKNATVIQDATGQVWLMAAAPADLGKWRRDMEALDDEEGGSLVHGDLTVEEVRVMRDPVDWQFDDEPCQLRRERVRVWSPSTEVSSWAVHVSDGRQGHLCAPLAPVYRDGNQVGWVAPAEQWDRLP